MVTKVSNYPVSSFSMRILPYQMTFVYEMHQIMENLNKPQKSTENEEYGWLLTLVT